MKEEEIRPESLFNEYLALAEKDIRTFFLSSPFRYVPCPACGSTESSFRFRKMGFDYEECSRCGTLYVNPRPPLEAFQRYYSDSPSVNFWATHFYRETEEARRIKLVRPKAALVVAKIERYSGKPEAGSVILDIGSGYGVLCEELARILPPGCTLAGIEPSLALGKVCREKGIAIIQKQMEDVDPADLPRGTIVAAISFELLEHLHDPSTFLDACHRALPAKALLILTTLSWAGFDLQVLRERSRSIHPPHHINFLTPDSIRILLGRHGFDCCEVTTPGKLDIDITVKQIADVSDPFIRRLLSSDAATREAFQEVLARTCLSSHMMVVARRR
jgi:SAM-dependent methyltransferase